MGMPVFGALSFVLGHTWYQIHHLRFVYILGLGRLSLKRHPKVIFSVYFCNSPPQIVGRGGERPYQLVLCQML